MTPLDGVTVVSLAPNLPGPAAAHRLTALGARVTRVEPPSGDFLALGAPAYHAELVAGQQVVTIDLKSAQGRSELETMLAGGDVLLTSSRPSALAKLGLAWDDLADVLLTKPAVEWQEWARERDLPLAAVTTS